MDQWLTELGAHRATWLVQEVTCLAGASWPYSDSDVSVERMLLETVSHEQIRRVASGDGEVVATAELLGTLVDAQASQLGGRRSAGCGCWAMEPGGSTPSGTSTSGGPSGFSTSGTWSGR